MNPATEDFYICMITSGYEVGLIDHLSNDTKCLDKLLKTFWTKCNIGSDLFL